MKYITLQLDPHRFTYQITKNLNGLVLNNQIRIPETEIH